MRPPEPRQHSWPGNLSSSYPSPYLSFFPVKMSVPHDNVSCHNVTMSPCHHVTMSPCHLVTPTCERVRPSWHGTVCHCRLASFRLRRLPSPSGNCTHTLFLAFSFNYMFGSWDDIDILTSVECMMYDAMHNTSFILHCNASMHWCMNDNLISWSPIDIPWPENFNCWVSQHLGKVQWSRGIVGARCCI